MGGTLRGRGGVFELDVTSGRVRPLMTGDMGLSMSSATRDLTRAAGTRSLPAEPGEIAVVDLAAGHVAAVTTANPWFKQIEVAQMRPLTWKSKDGMEVEGLLWLPASYQAGHKLPFILSIHGGPAGVWGTSFRGINHLFASLGWAVLEPNVRGSTSYGDALLRGNTKDIGGGDYNDAMTGVDAIAQGIADPNQLAIRGWSYGGILGGWTITQTNRFKAASLGAMVSDWTSEYAMGFNHDVRLWYISGTPWDNPEAYRRQSSYTHIAKVTTPTLLLHGEEDDTDTIGQSMMFYQGLKDRGVPTRFIRFPREPHGFREPHHVRIRDAEEISWLMKYTRGVEWKAPERKDEKDAKKPTTTRHAAALDLIPEAPCGVEQPSHGGRVIELAGDLAEVVGQLREQRPQRLGVGGEDALPDRRRARGEPRGVAQAVARQRSPLVAGRFAHHGHQRRRHHLRAGG